MSTTQNISQFEARAYKRLYELQNSTLHGIIHRVKNSLEFHKERPDEREKMLEHIADKSKWDFYGIQSKADSAVIKALEDCLKPPTNE